MDFNVEIRNAVYFMPSKDEKFILVTKGSLFFVMRKNRIEADVSLNKKSHFLSPNTLDFDQVKDIGNHKLLVSKKVIDLNQVEIFICKSKDIWNHPNLNSVPKRSIILPFNIFYEIKDYAKNLLLYPVENKTINVSKILIE